MGEGFAGSGRSEELGYGVEYPAFSSNPNILTIYLHMYEASSFGNRDVYKLKLGIKIGSNKEIDLADYTCYVDKNKVEVSYEVKSDIRSREKKIEDILSMFVDADLKVVREPFNTPKFKRITFEHRGEVKKYFSETLLNLQSSVRGLDDEFGFEIHMHKPDLNEMFAKIHDGYTSKSKN